jgi:uncharacterized membrane protein YcaP (DUF421 family)
MHSPLSIDWNSIFQPSVGVLEVVIRGSIMYLALFTILRFIARRQSGRIGTADLLVIVLIADAAQNALGKDYQSVTEGIALVLTIVAWEYLLDWLAWRFPTLRGWLQAEPLKLVSGGQILADNMRREMLSEDELRAALRHKGIVDIRRVEELYIEQSGQFSIVERQQGTPP